MFSIRNQHKNSQFLFAVFRHLKFVQFQQHNFFRTICLLNQASSFSQISSYNWSFKKMLICITLRPYVFGITSLNHVFSMLWHAQFSNTNVVIPLQKKTHLSLATEQAVNLTTNIRAARKLRHRLTIYGKATTKGVSKYNPRCQSGGISYGIITGPGRPMGILPERKIIGLIRLCLTLLQVKIQHA